jgi:hypothetical protein
VRLGVVESLLERYLADVGASLDRLVAARESGLIPHIRHAWRALSDHQFALQRAGAGSRGLA